MSFRLTVLPDVVRFDLGTYAEDETPDVHPFEGLTAVCKPLDTETWAAWCDAWPTDETQRKAMTVLVKQQLVTIEGIDAAHGGPYDHAKHFRALPISLVGAIYKQLWDRSTLSEQQEKNSDSPSGSDGPTPSAA